MARVLIVDDEPEVLLMLAEHAFSAEGIEFLVARAGEEGLRHAEMEPPDAILLSVMLPDLTGIEIFQRIRLLGITAPVIFTTLTTGTETALEAMKLGAMDYLFKPIDLAQLRRVLGQALEMNQERFESTTLPPQADHEEIIVGCSPSMRELYQSVGKVASADGAVLLLGEPGTGKELIAQALHQHSPRAHEPFLALNCGTHSDAVLEAELFGLEKGPFAGGDRRRIGKAEQGHGGTVFLDEVANLPLVTQSRLLRLIQDQTFQRDGGSESVRANVRVIASTAHDLAALVAAGLFRADLHQLLNTHLIVVPPLRVRVGDLALLARHFLRRFSRQFGKDLREIRADAMDLMEGYGWPGNVRELQSVVKQSVLAATSDVLTPAALPDYLRHPESVFGRPELVPPIVAKSDGTDGEFDRLIRERLKDSPDALYDEVLAKMERLLFRRVLEHTNGRQLQASQILGIGRRRLREKLRALGMTISRTVADTEDDE